MALLTGMTEDGREVPVQVDASGRLVAEGLQGPAGGTGPTGPAGPAGPVGPTGPADTSNPWQLAGAEIAPKRPGDVVQAPAGLKVGGTTSAPGVLIDNQGKIATSAPVVIHDNILTLSSAKNGTALDVHGRIASFSLAYSLELASIRFLAGESGYSDLGGLAFYTTGYDGHKQRARFRDNGDLVIGQSGLGVLQLTHQGNIVAEGVVAHTYENNAAARAAALPVGHFYRKADGTLMVAY